jgi:hypothetical protein
VRCALVLLFLVSPSLACSGAAPSEFFATPSPGSSGGQGDDASPGVDAAGPAPEAGAEDATEPPETGPTADAAQDAPVDAPSTPETGTDAGAPPGTVACGTATCTAPAFCCVSNSGQMQTCEMNATACSGQDTTAVHCTSSTQCASGDVCCGQRTTATGQYDEVSCVPEASCTGNDRQFCSRSVPSDCPQGKTCQLSSILTSYYACF